MVVYEYVLWRYAKEKNENLGREMSVFNHLSKLSSAGKARRCQWFKGLFYRQTKAAVDGPYPNVECRDPRRGGDENGQES